jgi:hypothetical protein
MTTVSNIALTLLIASEKRFQRVTDHPLVFFLVEMTFVANLER